MLANTDDVTQSGSDKRSASLWSPLLMQQNLLVANDHLRKLEPEYHGLNVYPNYFYNCHGFFYFEAFHK